jgi:tetratricopeptide (TPR) repeat protein
MTKWIAIILLLGCVSPVRGVVVVGDTPTLKTRAMDGTTVDLAQLRDKIVLVDFWIGTADSNRTNEKALVELYKTYKDKGVVFIGVATHPKPDQAARVIGELGITWPQIYEPSWRAGLGAEWGVPRVNWDFLIAPGGKVVFVGDFNQLREQLDAVLAKYPPKLVPDDVLAKAKQDLDTVEALLNDKDREGAIRKFTRLPDEANKDPDFATRAMAVREKINDAADALLKEVDDDVAAKHFARAAPRMRELLSVMAGLPTASLARQHLAELVARPEIQREIEQLERREKAQAALESARKLRDDGYAEEAYAKFKAVAVDYKGTPAGDAAAEAVKAFESDAAFVRRSRDRAAAPAARRALNLAENYLSAGRPEQARKKYEEVIRDFPDPSFAQTAKEQLAKMK